MFFVLAAMFALAALGAGARACDQSDHRAPTGNAPKRRAAAWRAIAIVLAQSVGAHVMLLAVGLEGALFQGVFAYVGADLHLRFGLSFTAIGLDHRRRSASAA